MRSSVNATARNRFRPQVELCESREVPAALTWAPQGSLDFYAASNWYVTGSTTRPQLGPVGGDDLTFDGAVSSASCPNLGELGPAPGGGTVGGSPGGGGSGPGTGEVTEYLGLNSLSLVRSYAGTVGIIAPLVTHVLTLSAAASGAISQPNGSGLTVDSTFTWTSGTLNSALNGATVLLSGATGFIDPGAGNSITSGSTLILNPRAGIGASLTLQPGTLTLAAGDGITVGALCRADVKPLPNALVTTAGITEENRTKRIYLDANSELYVHLPPGEANAEWKGDNLKFINAGGTAAFERGTVTTFGPATGATAAEAFIKQSSGVIALDAGATLSANPGNKGVTEITGGNLRVLDPAGGRMGLIIGDLIFSGGGIQFVGGFTELRIQGDVTWSGGNFSPRVDVASDGTGDVWDIRGKLQIPKDSRPMVLPDTFNYNPVTGVPAAFRWQVLKFQAVDLPPNGNLPEVGTVPGRAPLKWYIIKENGRDVWKLGR